MFKFISKSLSIFVLFLASTVLISGQTTIFNLPSTDVLQKSGTRIEADFSSHLDKYSNGGFQKYGF